MDPTVIGKPAVNLLKTGIDVAGDSLTKGGNRLTSLIHAFAPDFLLSWFQGGRLRVRQIKAQETVFDQVCVAVEASAKAQSKFLAANPDRLLDAVERLKWNELVGDLRMLSTLRQAVKICPPIEKLRVCDIVEIPRLNDKLEVDDLQADASWWDTVESFARRRNEAWRTDLLARAIVAYEDLPGSISLKSIWEIGMMEGGDFGCLSAFCDSALDIDGKAVVLLDPTDQAKFFIDSADGLRSINLAHAISSLVDAGLVHQSRIEFETTEEVILGHLGGPTYFNQTHPQRSTRQPCFIQIDAFGGTNVAMDICKLYSARRNAASDANFELFKSIMKETAKNKPEQMGKVSFRKKPS